MKKNILALFFVLSSFPLFAGSSGIFIGEGKIFHAKTKYFDIIYCERSKESAEKLFYNADAIYEKIAENYGHEIWFKMPVVISPANEKQNAYFSLLYYPHIVIYDTASDETTRNNNDDILSTFSHELTHAYTLQLKNGFWQALDMIIGAVANAAGITITAGWTEGSAVMTESEGGIEGRLNDGWAIQMLKQAKVEGVFPTYYDIQGADDKYPLGSFYYFNSFFNLWLKENYGMEKYSEFWWRCVNLKSITAGGAFKKVYGKKLKVAWKEFQDSIDVSDIKPILKTDDIFGFGEKGFVIDSLVQCDKKIAFIEKKTNSVWVAELVADSTGLPTANLSPKKLFILSNISKISISSDGKYIACTYFSSRHAATKKQVKIYDTEKKHFYKLGEIGLQDAAILKNGENYYLVALKFSSQKKSIVVKKLDFGGEKKRFSVSDVAEYQQEAGVYPYDFVDFGDGNFAYIEKSGMNWSVKTSNGLEIPLGDKNARYLAAGREGLIFSWAEKNGFSQEGRIFFDENGEAKVSFSDIQESGGVYFPTGDFCVKKFYRESGIFRSGLYTESNVVSDNAILNDAENANDFSDISNEAYTEQNRNEEESFVAASKRYNYFIYPKKGLFLPVANFSSYETSPISKQFLNKTDSLGVGALYMTSNPWGKGVFSATSGYFFNSGNYGAAISYSSGTETSLFSYSLASQVEFHETDFKENRNTIRVSSTIPVFNFSNFVFSDTAALMLAENNLIYGKNSLEATFTTIHQTGMSIYERFGFSVGVAGVYEKARYFFLENDYVEDAVVISPMLVVRFPHLIPIRNKDFFTYNLPFRLAVQGFSGDNNYFSATGELYLFAMEIEKAIPIFTAVFINRFLISAGYNYNFWDSNKKLNVNFWNTGDDFYSTDSVFLNLTLGATPNFGQAARTQLYMEFLTQFVYRIRMEDDEKSNFAWGFKLKANFLNFL